MFLLVDFFFFSLLILTMTNITNILCLASFPLTIYFFFPEFFFISLAVHPSLFSPPLIFSFSFYVHVTVTFSCGFHFLDLFFSFFHIFHSFIHIFSFFDFSHFSRSFFFFFSSLSNVTIIFFFILLSLYFLFLCH